MIIMNKDVYTKYKICDQKGHITCELSVNGIDKVCECTISVNVNIHSWNISSWFTKPKFMNRGFGRLTLMKALRYCVNKYGDPAAINYTWNGTNLYVLEWLNRHFDAVCTCPIAVQKTQSDDDWSSHIYKLNKRKVLEYFEL